ncbi:MAG TPA: hypothetical protein VN914_11145, partial [Polyangia bacterium]|nr:hypothetical protein [Polyangia bacterium]
TGGSNTGGSNTGGSNTGGSNTGGSNTGGSAPGGAGGMPMTGSAWMAAAANLAGVDSECGNVSGMASRPDRDMLIVGVAKQGLWASTNGSAMWTKLGTGAGSAMIVNRSLTYIFDPAHPDTWWESGIYNGGGVYRTTDNGNTFVQLGDTHHNDGFSVDLTDPDRKLLLAGGHEMGQHLIKSVDGGMTWTDIGMKLPASAGATSWPHIVDSKTFLVATYNSGEGGIFRSTDGGETWTRVAKGAFSSAAVVGYDKAIFWTRQGPGGVRSTDNGATWTEFGNNPSPGNQLVELPDHRLVSILDRKMVYSSDRGASWKSAGPDLPWSANGLVYSSFRKAIYAYHFGCGNGSVPVQADQIVRLPFE